MLASIINTQGYNPSVSRFFVALKRIYSASYSARMRAQVSYNSRILQYNISGPENKASLRDSLPIRKWVRLPVNQFAVRSQ